MKNVWSYTATPSYFFTWNGALSTRTLIFLWLNFYASFVCMKFWSGCTVYQDMTAVHTNKVKMYNLYMNTFLKCIHHTWIQFNILYFVMFGYNKDKQMRKKKSYTAWWQRCHVAVGLESLHCNDVPCSICNPDWNCCPNLYTQIWVN